MLRTTVGALLILALLGPAAQAQFPGSTPEGDYLRGVGIAAMGMGLYNERTALANRMNANTFITLNEYMWNAVKEENRENAEHRREMLARAAEAKKKLDERIHDHPEPTDVMSGDALNAALGDLMAPGVSDSASRYAQVPIEAGIIRRIPFKLGEKGEKFSMSRLSLKGPLKWVVAFQNERLAPYRLAYQHAVDYALDLAIEGKMTAEAIRDVERAVDSLEGKLRRMPEMHNPSNQRTYSEAKAQVDRLRDAARLFKTLKIQQVFAEIDSYAGTTVDDLRIFMRRHGLTFAPADTPDERTLYPQLYTALVVQRRKATGDE